MQPLEDFGKTWLVRDDRMQRELMDEPAIELLVRAGAPCKELGQRGGRLAGVCHRPLQRRSDDDNARLAGHLQLMAVFDGVDFERDARELERASQLARERERARARDVFVQRLK